MMFNKYLVFGLGGAMLLAIIILSIKLYNASQPIELELPDGSVVIQKREKKNQTETICPATHYLGKDGRCYVRNPSDK